MYKTTYDKSECQTGIVSRDLKSILMSHTYEREIDMLAD
jgi:hypothetical protein